MKKILEEMNIGNKISIMQWDFKVLSNYFNSLCSPNEVLIDAINQHLYDDTDTLYLFKINNIGRGDIFNLKQSPKYIEEIGNGKWVSIIYFSSRDGVMYITPCNQIEPDILVQQINKINSNFFVECKDYNSMPRELIAYLLENMDTLQKFQEVINFRIDYSFSVIKNSKLYQYIDKKIRLGDTRVIQYLITHPSSLREFDNFFNDNIYKKICNNGRDLQGRL